METCVRKTILCWTFWERKFWLVTLHWGTQRECGAQKLNWYGTGLLGSGTAKWHRQWHLHRDGFPPSEALLNFFGNMSSLYFMKINFTLHFRIPVIQFVSSLSLSVVSHPLPVLEKHKKISNLWWLVPYSPYPNLLDSPHLHFF